MPEYFYDEDGSLKEISTNYEETKKIFDRCKSITIEKKFNGRSN